MANVEARVAGEAARANEAVAASLDAANMDKAKLEASLAKAKEAVKAQIAR